MRARDKNRSQVQAIPAVQHFLESKGRNSINTSRTFLTALLHFNNLLMLISESQLQTEERRETVETILQSIREGRTNVYKLLDLFVSDQSKRVSVKTVKLHLAAVISYLGWHDIEIVPNKLKKMVTIPKTLYEPEHAVDATDIRILLLKCNNQRLKTYLLVLASGGMRTVEALAIRIKDIDFETKPTTIHIRGEFSKTKRARDIFISDEAADALKDRIDLKYKNGRPRNLEGLVFHRYHPQENSNPRSLYPDMSQEFSKLRNIAGFVNRKDNSKRHVITLNSFRAFVQTTISNSAGKDFAEWFLGHSKSPYWKTKPEAKREIYLSKCAPYLTFLDYFRLEAMERGNEADLLEKEKQIQDLRTKMADIEYKDNEIEELKKRVNNLDSGLRFWYNQLNSQMREMAKLLPPPKYPLTDKARARIEEIKEAMGDIADLDYNAYDEE